MFYIDKDVYSRLMDDESRLLYEGRLEYSLTHDKHKLFSVLDKRNIEYLGWDISLLERDYESSKKIYLYGAGKLGVHGLNILQK